MKCEKCDSENPPLAKFCNECGHSLINFDNTNNYKNREYKQYNSSERIIEKDSATKNLALNFFLSAERFLELRRYNDALFDSQKAIKFATEIGYWEIVSKSYLLMSKIYLGLGNYEEAYYSCELSLEYGYKSNDDIFINKIIYFRDQLRHIKEEKIREQQRSIDEQRWRDEQLKQENFYINSTASNNNEKIILNFDAEVKQGHGGIRLFSSKLNKNHRVFLTNKRIYSTPSFISGALGAKGIGVNIDDIQEIRYKIFPLGFAAQTVIRYNASAMVYYLKIGATRSNIDSLINELKMLKPSVQIIRL